MRILTRLVMGTIVLLMLGIIALVWFGPAYVERSRNVVLSQTPAPVSDAAQVLHDDMIVGDWHADPLLWNRDLSKRGTRGQMDVPRLIEGGVALQVFTAVTKSPAGQNYDNNATDAFDNITPLTIAQLWPPRTWGDLTERALYQARKLQKVAAKSDLQILRTRADLEALLKARASGAQTVGAILGIEGAHALKGDLDNMDRLYDAGYRLVGLHHFFDNELGGSLHGQTNAGLTDFGRAVVRQIAARGMILDLAHSSPQVVRDVLAMDPGPVVVSHTGIKSHCNVKRNLPDDLMRGVAATGGTIGIGYWAEIACGDITPDGIARMIVKAIDTVGENHVSLGSDFDGSVKTFFDTSQLAELTQALLDIGLSEQQIRKVMGENMVRVLRARLR